MFESKFKFHSPLVQSLTNCPQKTNTKENLLLSRDKRSIISADVASTYAAFLAPESLSVSLAISLSIIIFQVLGYGLWGKYSGIFFQSGF